MLSNLRRGHTRPARRLRPLKGRMDLWTVWLIHQLKDFGPVEVMIEILWYLDGSQLLCLQQARNFSCVPCTRTLMHHPSD